MIAGVCGGLASALRVDATLVRLAFALLALAGGAGILLYLALWAHSEGRRPVVATGLAVAAVAALLVALGMSGTALIGATLILVGAAVAAARGGSLRPGGSLPVAAIGLTTAGAVVLLGHLGASGSFVAPGAIAGALILVLGPWLWQLAAERSERIRLAERAAVAAHVHDSVLQTLALVQRHADDPGRVAAVARRQERELRRWLYGTGVEGATTLEDALADAAAEIEELLRVRIELATAGTCRSTPPTSSWCWRRGRRWRTRPSSPAPTRSPSTPRPTTTSAPSTSATVAAASTPQPSLQTGAASPSRSRAACSGQAARRRSARSPAKAPRSSSRLQRNT